MDRNQRKLHIFSEQKGEQKILVTLQKFVIWVAIHGTLKRNTYLLERVQFE
jgi:hypothetical protein